MRTNIEILQEVFESSPQDALTERRDLQLAITSDPELSRILLAMNLAQQEVMNNVNKIFKHE
jgi:hypothetical protein